MFRRLFIDLLLLSIKVSYLPILVLFHWYSCSMYITYKAHNRWTKETFLIGSDVDVNIFSAFRSIPSGTIDINLKSCILNRHKLRQSQIATLSSQFVIIAVTAQTESNNTANVFCVLGRVPMYTFDMNMKTYIFAHSSVISLVYLFVCMYISYKSHNRCTQETFLKKVRFWCEHVLCT